MKMDGEIFKNLQLGAFKFKNLLFAAKECLLPRSGVNNRHQRHGSQFTNHFR